MRNSLKDEKHLEKTYTSVNCLYVFGFYILILLFLSTISSKWILNIALECKSTLQGI